jgi:putative ABC transport system permease protein
MKSHPPKWADRFLAWYCNPQLLEDIQGDVHELYQRSAKKSKHVADVLFIWNVIRFFRWKNIRKRKNKYSDQQFSTAMIKNLLLVSVRNFLRQPGHSILNVLGLCVGFFCAFLILVWVTFEFSFDKFHADTDRLFTVVTHVQGNGDVQTYNAASVALDVSSVAEADKLVSVLMGDRWPNVLCFKAENKAKECIYLKGVYANENLFAVFNFPILKGDPYPLNKPDHIAISEKMAYMLFSTDDAIGKIIKIDGRHEVTIASVFQNVPTNSTMQFDFALPFAIVKKLWGTNENQFAENFFHTYLKTNTNISAASLTEKLNDVRVVTERYKAEKMSYQAVPLTDWRLKSKFENGKQTGGRMEYVIIFIVIGSLVVLMAVINFINLTTARATTRAKEIGIRKVTGAYRSSIILQFIGESFFIVLIAFLLAALAAQLTLPFFNTLLGEQISIGILDHWMPAYLLALLVAISLLAGLYPAFVLSSFHPVKILKSQLSTNITGSQRLRKILLVVQLSVSTGIIIFTGVLYLQLRYVTKKNLGFDRENMIRLEPTGDLFRNFDAFKNELAKSPSIISIAASASNPLSTTGSNTGVRWQGKPKDLRITFKTIACTYDFPETMGLKIIEGRNFQQQSKDTVNTEVLVTQEAVKTMNLKEPVGSVIYIGDASCVVIGVTNDFHTESLHEQRLPVILYRTDYMHTSAVYVKYQPGTTQQAVEALSAAYNQIEKNFTMQYRFQDDTFNELYKTEITASHLVLLFTIIALVISVLGILGLATYNVHRKTKEIGIRRVFGASVTQVMALLTSEFSWIMLLAMLLSCPVAWVAANRWLTGFAYRIVMPWWIYLMTFVSVALLTVTIVCLQGLKTVTTNPTKTLRNE